MVVRRGSAVLYCIKHRFDVINKWQTPYNGNYTKISKISSLDPNLPTFPIPYQTLHRAGSNYPGPRVGELEELG